jgi:hypothetical protein
MRVFRENTEMLGVTIDSKWPWYFFKSYAFSPIDIRAERAMLSESASMLVMIVIQFQSGVTGFFYNAI